MTGKSKFKNPANEAIPSAASGLFSVDAISFETMHHLIPHALRFLITAGKIL